MDDLLLELVPLIVGSAVVPAHIVVTILLVRGPGGRLAGLAWVAGMTTVRLLQGLVFGVLLEAAEEVVGGEPESRLVVAVLLLVLAIVFYGVAAKAAVKTSDEDAPPPRWMAMLDGVTPPRAFAMGAGMVGISAKLWVFTLGAIAAIEAAGLGGPASAAVFVGFVLLAQVVHIGVVGVAFAAPERADRALARFADGLDRYNRPIMIGLGVVFGTWFLLKALDGLGIL